MKNAIVIILLFMCIGLLHAQSVKLTPVVHPTQGVHCRLGNTALSWTLGEPTNNTLRNGNIMLTQGFQQVERPQAMDSIASKRVCSDTTEQIVFQNVTAGKWASNIEWALSADFSSSQFIKSGDSIVLSVDSGAIDTIWLRSSIGLNGIKSSTIFTKASVLPNISAVNRITVANTLCETVDTINLIGIGVTGDYTYKWQSSNNGIDFIEIPSANDSHYDLNQISQQGAWFRKIIYQDSRCEKISNTIKVR